MRYPASIPSRNCPGPVRVGPLYRMNQSTRSRSEGAGFRYSDCGRNSAGPHHHATACVPQRHQHRADNYQFAGGSDHPIGGVPQFLGCGGSPRRAGLGNHGFRGPKQPYRSLVAVAHPRTGYNHRGNSHEPVWRLVAGYAGSQAASFLKNYRRCR